MNPSKPPQSGGREPDDEPIRIEDLEKPIPFDNAEPGGVSHAPLDLGSGGPTPTTPTTSVSHAKPVPEKPAAKVISQYRITGVKTFFTKLHPGALDFLDQQITDWLMNNPGIKVKWTNVTTGEVQAKKTEPNIIINVWY